MEDCDGKSVGEWSRGKEVSSLGSGGELWMKVVSGEEDRSERKGV